jgi:hypothetical protein
MKRWTLCVLAVLAATTLPSRDAGAADRDLLTQTGDKGTLVFDQLAGFRATQLDGVGYTGPIGFNFKRYGQDLQNGGTQSVKSTNLWLAPTADYFVINHLSIGGIIELVRTSGSVTTDQGNVSTTVDLPVTLDFTIAPRVGYAFALTDRWAIWPRLAIGYLYKQSIDNPFNRNPDKVTFSAPFLGIDVNVIYRVTEQFFLRLGPDFDFTFAGKSTVTQGNVEQSTSANYLQFGLTGSLGVMFDL